MTHDPLLPQNWMPLLVGIEPKDTTKPKIGIKKDVLLATRKENTSDFSQTAKLEKF